MQIKYNFIHTIRSLYKQKGFTFLNFLGLSVAAAAAILVGLTLFYERSFDSFHTDSNRIFRVVTHMTGANNEPFDFAGPAVLAPTAARAEMADLGQWAEVFLADKEVVRLSTSNFFQEKNLLFADTAFFDLFHFEVKTGNGREALRHPNQVLLTASTAARYFPNENAVGKSFTIDMESCPNKLFEVVGIVADAPANSHLPYTMLISASSKPIDKDASWGWFSGGQFLYVKTAPNVEAALIGQQLSNLANTRKDAQDEGKYTYQLQPLADIHTNMLFADSNPSYTLNFEQFYWMGAVALFLLLIAIVNYVNLSTAIAHRKIKEIGVRKTLGASRGQLAGRFWLETGLLVGAALLASGILVNALLPVLNKFLDRQIFVHWFSLEMTGFLLCLFALTTLAAGFYPALVLSGFSPAEAFRGKIWKKSAQTSLNMRRGLVTFQFVVAQVFLMAVIVTASQMDFIRSKPLGFKSDAIVNFRVPDDKKSEISALRNEISRIPGVRMSTLCTGAPTSSSGVGVRFNKPELFEQQTFPIAIKVADQNYLETYGLTLLAGRFIQEGDMKMADEKIPEAEKNAICVLNETAVRQLGYPSPQAAIGQKIKVSMNNLGPEIVGVVKDFHTSSLREEIRATSIMPFERFYFSLGVRLEESAANAVTLSKIEGVWKQFFPDQIFKSVFLDEYIASLYHDEQSVYALFRIMAILALLINALGLIGLTVFVVEAKTKEIGVRKVLGASVNSIVRLLSRDYLAMAAIAMIFASPLAYFAMQRWLEDFSYRIELKWWMFASAGLAALAVAFLTVGFQSVKAALANPVKSLRSE